MEDKTSLFGLAIDPVTRKHLGETARWARFLAIAGLLALLLVIVSGIYSMTLVSKVEERYGYPGTSVDTSVGAIVIIAYFIVFLVYIFPVVFMLRFSGKMQKALDANDQELLNQSFQNLKACFRYISIVTIVFFVLMAISLITRISSSV